MNHELLIQTILNHNGIIHGGYVRAWVSEGHPTDHGWKDIDCIFKNLDEASRAILELEKFFKEKCPKIDIKWQNRNYYDDFFCNCWFFNGELNLIEPAKSIYSIEELKKINQNKIAKCIRELNLINYPAFRLKKMVDYGWKILDNTGKEIQNIESFIYEQENQVYEGLPFYGHAQRRIS